MPLYRKIASALLVSIALLASGCGGGSGGSSGGGSTPAITSVAVACSPGSINTNQTSTCTPTVSGTGNYSSSITWSVSPESIGTVSSAGVFTPSGAGTATITATSTEDSSKSGNATVTVAAQSTITSVSVICTPTAILTTQTSTCTATVQGTGSYSSAVTWAASDGTIASSGVFTPASLGIATITAKSSQDSTKSGTISISVVNSTTSGAWTWMNGSTSNYAVGFYGTKGVASPSNVPDGRGSAASWMDKSGNFWLFSGYALGVGGTATPNDLWEYNPSTNEWTFMGGNTDACTRINPTTCGYYWPGVYGTKGVAGTNNLPGGRFDAVSWTDSSGNFWLFGGTGEDSTGSGGGGYLNDLWEFNLVTGEWTWESGSNIAGADGIYGTLGTPSISNTPGARDGSVSWVDSSGNLWLFGGELPNGASNDLWRFNPTTKAWTWVSGSSTINASAVYGSLGVAAPNNVPGARFGADGWIDRDGNLWLFGGTSIVSTGAVYLNDLWKFNPASEEWAWMNGSSTTNGSAVYGTLGVASSNTTPGVSFQQSATASWSDSSGDFWLFDGNIWKFSPTTDQWTWISESGTAVVYGTKGTPSASNFPGGGAGSACWTDNNGNFWLFGGGYQNILWRYQP